MAKKGVVTITLNDVLAVLQRFLDDEKGEVWSSDQLKGYIQGGYDTLCRDTQCLFDIVMYDTQPRMGNYTKEFEKDFMVGFPIFNRFTVTRESDAEYVDESLISNHTRPTDAQFMTDASGPTPTVNTTRVLPDRAIAVDRVTHNWLRLDPEHDRYFRKTRQWYQTIEGGVFSYSMDQDGWQNLRLVNVPVSVVATEEITGLHGAIRQITSYDLSAEPIIGSYGAVRVVPRHFSGQQYGVLRRIVPDEDNTRVEYYRTGNDLEFAPFELPHRVIKYVVWWAMGRAYSQPGEGENKKLAEHFKARYRQGADTLKKRIQAVNSERTIAMGSKRETGRDGYLQHFPANYGYSRPFGRG